MKFAEIGSTVYILEYEDDLPCDFGGYILLMKNKDYACLSPVFNDIEEPYELCGALYGEYLQGCSNDTIIVPIVELYTREEAEKAVKNAQDD